MREAWRSGMRRWPKAWKAPMTREAAEVTIIPAGESSQLTETRAMRTAARPMEMSPSTEARGCPIAVCAWMSAIEEPRRTRAGGAKTRAKSPLLAWRESSIAVRVMPSSMTRGPQRGPSDGPRRLLR